MSMSETGIAYFDNAATSWPKPAGVGRAMTHYLESVGGSPGRYSVPTTAS